MRTVANKRRRAPRVRCGGEPGIAVVSRTDGTAERKKGPALAHQVQVPRYARDDKEWGAGSGTAAAAAGTRRKPVPRNDLASSSNTMIRNEIGIENRIARSATFPGGSQ